MKIKRIICTVPCLLFAAFINAQNINVIYTTDVHGAFFPFDYVNQETSNNSLAQVCTYVNSVRDTAENVILLDCGDILQGTPATYYYNYVDTISGHVASKIMNYMKYDAGCIGNHDIETTHSVYDKFVHDCNMPILGANAIRTSTGKPYFEPYKIFTVAGKKIAVLGLITPYIPHWLHESIWSGMTFDDMVESSEKWIKYIKENEHPDVVIGLFHSGVDFNYGNQSADTYKNENAVALVAQKVAGFDAILFGHDHKLYNKTIKNPLGNDVALCDAGVGARNVGLVTININKEGNKRVKTDLISVVGLQPDPKFMHEFAPQMLAVKAYSHKKICNLKNDVFAYESLFGSSAFVDMVQTSMMKHTGADISFSAPLLIDTELEAGPITVGKMFSVYRYENKLYLLELKGKEIKNYMEYSYDLWIQNPAENNGNILKVDKYGRLINRSYNFDAALGIDYTVDVTKPKGERIKIKSMSNGKPFDIEAKYKVSVNSYRGNGGGGHLEFGAGIPKDQIQNRVIKSINKDLRYLMIQDFMEKGDVTAKPVGNWRFIPESVAKPAIEKQKKEFK